MGGTPRPGDDGELVSLERSVVLGNDASLVVVSDLSVNKDSSDQVGSDDYSLSVSLSCDQTLLAALPRSEEPVLNGSSGLSSLPRNELYHLCLSPSLSLDEEYVLVSPHDWTAPDDLLLQDSWVKDSFPAADELEGVHSVTTQTPICSVMTPVPPSQTIQTTLSLGSTSSPAPGIGAETAGRGNRPAPDQGNDFLRGVNLALQSMLTPVTTGEDRPAMDQGSDFLQSVRQTLRSSSPTYHSFSAMYAHHMLLDGQTFFLIDLIVSLY